MLLVGALAVRLAISGGPVLWAVMVMMTPWVALVYLLFRDISHDASGHLR